MRVYIDMDGVLTDFVGALCTLTGYTDAWPTGEYDICKVLGHDVWDQMTEQGEDFWMNMEKTAECDNVMSMAMHYDYYICTSPSLDPYSASGKMHWLQMNLPYVKRRFFITPHKHHMAKDNLLIDDSDENIARWREAGGVGLLFPRIWNSGWRDLDAVNWLRKIPELIK